MESIYKNDTKYISTDMKEKLSWIRFNDYSCYGEKLAKSDPQISATENELFSVASYNVLGQELLEKHSYLYTDHDVRSLDWELRSKIIFEELELLNADILCLQEVESRLVDSFYNENLNRKGYQGIFKQKTCNGIDGCAIYFKTEKFDLVESASVDLFRESITLLDRGNVGIVLKLSLKKKPEAIVVVATTHLLFNRKRSDIRLAQMQIMLAEIEKMAYVGFNHSTKVPNYLPIIFTGDMNFSPDSAIYKLLTQSHLVYEGLSRKTLERIDDRFILYKRLLPSWLGITDSCQYLSELSSRDTPSRIRFESGSLYHYLNLSSVYAHQKEEFPEVTSNIDDWVTVDYIFYSQSYDERMMKCEGKLKLVSKVALPNVEEIKMEVDRIPNLGCGSDHFPLLAKFHLIS